MKETAKTMTRFSAGYLHNQNGFALILSMVMLAVLSILGVMVLNSTDTELKITTNSRIMSDSFVATELATEYAMQRVIEDPGSIGEGTNYDLVNDDDDIADILPPGVELLVGGNEIDFYTGQAPTAMGKKTSVDAYLGNIYRTTSSASSGAGGDAAYYRVSVETRAKGRTTTRIETLFVNRGGQIF